MYMKSWVIEVYYTDYIYKVELIDIFKYESIL